MVAAAPRKAKARYLLVWGQCYDLKRPELSLAGSWMGGRAVEGTGLENRQTLTGLVGSNPTLPAYVRIAVFVREAFCGS